MTYTLWDFDMVRASLMEADEAGEGVPADARVFAALRIAANVMRPGVIEAAVTQRLDDESSPTDDDLSAAIRAALLGDAGHD